MDKNFPNPSNMPQLQSNYLISLFTKKIYPCIKLNVERWNHDKNFMFDLLGHHSPNKIPFILSLQFYEFSCLQNISSIISLELIHR